MAPRVTIKAVNDELARLGHQARLEFNAANVKAFEEHHAAAADRAMMLPCVAACRDAMHAADRRVRLRAGVMQRCGCLISTPCCCARREQNAPTVKREGIDQ
jgi:hypothetical protein